MKKVLLEGLFVAAIGATLAFASNALSPRGLKLTRDFFPASPAVTGQVQVLSSTNRPGTNSASALEALKLRLQSKGLQLADSNQVVQLFHDPAARDGHVIFVDAREDTYYQEGHIPNAYQLDYYRPDNYLPTVLPACQLAEHIVVYCNGGTCEDSEFSATFLLSAGIPREKLLVYGGGMTEWATNGLPVEIGVRQSGQVTNYVKTAAQGVSAK